MTWLKDIYNTIFLGFILSIVCVFFFLRPLNSPWHKFIGGDGLGYYSYLPAKYIYHDTTYDFKWFNKVYNDNYINCSFKTPDENFMVNYKDTRINKYYQGLSFIWLPFFALAHIFAKLFSYPADGYSLPYQLSIGLASLFYLFIGLWYLKQLLKSMFHHKLISTLVPIILFYGSYLFYYALFVNSYSHVYSFTFITLFLYFTYSFFNGVDKKTTYLLLLLLSLVVIVCIRPLNGLILLSVPAFIPAHFFTKKIIWHFHTYQLLIVAFIILILGNELSILYTQTHSFIPYTYTNERFYFNHPKLLEVLFSYRAGLFVYVPISFVSLFGIFFLSTTKQKIFFPILFFLILFIYSSWWYWPVTSRTLIDYYPFIAIFLGALLHKLIYHRLKTGIAITLLIVLTGYHQLKCMQIHNGILDENYTYSELFWRNFFKTHKLNQYVIPPSSIVKDIHYSEDFETASYLGNKTKEQKYQGQYSGYLSAEFPFSSNFGYKIPNLFKEDGIKKIRFSFWCYFTKEITSAQIYFKYFDKHDSLLGETPYYINKENILYDSWDYKEFGYEIDNADKHFLSNFDHLSIFIWNNDAKNSLYIDNVKTEFIITNRNYDIVMPP